jgi:hypothetical protein
MNQRWNRRHARPVYDEYDDELSQIRRTPPPHYRYAEFDDSIDYTRPAGVPRRRIRSMFWRFIGALAICGAFYIIAQIAIHPDARRAITEWATLGHAQKVQSLERGVQKGVEWVRNR